MNALRLSLAAIVCVCPLAAQAANVTYNVNIVEPGASVTGTITTDGAQGPLQLSDFLSANLTYTIGADTVVGSNQRFDTTGTPQLTATANGLFVNLDNVSPTLFSIYSAANGDLEQNAGLTFCSAPSSFNGILNCGSNNSASPIDTLNIGTQQQDLGFVQAGNYEFAVNPNAPATTPEPSSMLLLSTGILAAGTQLRRRFLPSRRC